ncbi:dioxygenase [Burkholderia pseudomallei]|nr:dioxygenase [Burkholderia pseudomallei]EXJ00617.1 dioxygenase [Burkholderia pseudomallei MSHR6137]MBM5595054.1 dioxygenase [Burkholderia pseudomallei]
MRAHARAGLTASAPGARPFPPLAGLPRAVSRFFDGAVMP